MMFYRLFAVFICLAFPAIRPAQAEDLTAEVLAKKYGCTECHSRENDKTGPSFESIAAKTNVDVSGFDLAFVAVNSKVDIPEKHSSEVILAQVGKDMHIRIFDADGRKVVDRAAPSLKAESEFDVLKEHWTSNLLPNDRKLAEADRIQLTKLAAEVSGYTLAKQRERLKEVVKNGGKGNWTHVTKGLPMPPFGGRMTDSEIARVVDWVITGLAVPTLRVMPTGLGSGTITSDPAGIDCGADCETTFATGDTITLTAITQPGSSFLRWEGDATGSTNPIEITMSESRSVRAVFQLTTPIPKISAFTPEAIRSYLTANPIVNTPARFVSALPDVYKQNWILMSRSESLQTGNASSPRILLPSADAKFVFSVGMTEDSSYPGSHPNAIEYMQWDAGEKNFRFHEIVLDAVPAMGNDIPDPMMPENTIKTFPPRSRGIAIDDQKCFKCHSTQNVLNRSTFPGTTGITPGTTKFKNKPNWDAYDSWGGMLPFNRDRIYQGTVEAAAFRSLMNPWTWQSNPSAGRVIEQLQLQPEFGTLANGSVDPTPRSIPAQDLITRTVGGVNDGHVNFAFDVSPPVLIEPEPTGTDPSIDTNYNFDGQPGSGPATPVVRGGTNFVLLHHTSDVEGTSIDVEGRGVQLFDTLGLNQASIELKMF